MYSHKTPKITLELLLFQAQMPRPQTSSASESLSVSRPACCTLGFGSKTTGTLGTHSRKPPKMSLRWLLSKARMSTPQTSSASVSGSQPCISASRQDSFFKTTEHRRNVKANGVGEHLNLGDASSLCKYIQPHLFLHFQNRLLQTSLNVSIQVATQASCDLLVQGGASCVGCVVRAIARHEEVCIK